MCPACTPSASVRQRTAAAAAAAAGAIALSLDVLCTSSCSCGHGTGGPSGGSLAGLGQQSVLQPCQSAAKATGRIPRPCSSAYI